MSRFGPLADHLVATEPDADLVAAWNGLPDRPQIGARARAIGQLPISWDPSSVDDAVERTDIALVQIGGDTNDRFLEEAAAPFLEKLRAAAPSS